MSDREAPLPTTRTTGGADEWIVAGDQLPADGAALQVAFGFPAAGRDKWIAPLTAVRDGEQQSAGTLTLQRGRFTVQSTDQPRWGVRVVLLLWIAGWLVWLLRSRGRTVDGP